MTKINQKPLPASLQLTDEMPLNRSGADFRGNFEKVLDLMIAQGLLDANAAIAAGFLIGDPSAIYAENSSTGDRSQLDQVAIELTGDTPTPDCTQKYLFYKYGFSEVIEFQQPDNIPSSEFYFRVYLAGTGAVTFDDSYTELTGSQPFDNSGTGVNILHCYCISGERVYYKIENTLPSNVPQIAQGLITSAQILDSNSNPVELIPAPGSGKMIWIESLGYISDTGTDYTVNTSALMKYNGQTFGATIPLNQNGSVRPAASLSTGSLNTAAVANASFIFETEDGDPETGTFGVSYIINYRIIDDPFA